MFQQSETCREDPASSLLVFDAFCEVLFGINPANVDPSLFQLSYEAICERFPGIKTHDLQNAYKYSGPIIKKEFVKLTREELLEPVQIYWMKKMKAQFEVDELEKEIRIEREKEAETRVEIAKCKQIYLDSLASGEWKGNEFEAFTIVRNIADHFSDADMKAINQMARDEVNRINIQNESIDAKEAFKKLSDNEDLKIIIAPNYNRFRAYFFVKESVKRRFNFIQD